MDNYVGLATVVGTICTIALGIIGVVRWLIRISQEEGRRRQRLDDVEARVVGLPCEEHNRRIATLEGAGKTKRR